MHKIYQMIPSVKWNNLHYTEFLFIFLMETFLPSTVASLFEYIHYTGCPILSYAPEYLEKYASHDNIVSLI